MIYKDFKGLRLSALGMGTMRLPVINGDDSKVDQALVDEMVAHAMEGGVNYYDTAWAYHGGTSELALGKALSAYPRESFYLANKFPGYDLSNMDKVGEIFEAQLEKCLVDYFDFYLFHNVCELNIDAYLDPKHGILDYLLEQKRQGRIRHLGFSCHGAMPVLRRFLEAYGEHMEFCQIQLNYVDWSFQKAEKNGTAGKLRFAGLGHGTAQRRAVGKAIRGRGRDPALRRSRASHTGLGFPLSAEHTLRHHDALGHV